MFTDLQEHLAAVFGVGSSYGNYLYHGFTAPAQGESGYDLDRIRSHGGGGYRKGCKCSVCVGRRRGKAQRVRDVKKMLHGA
jgi:hypothetical protein